MKSPQATDKLNIVEVPSIREPIRPSPGFQKKALADYKLDIMGLCGFGCRYCSSNAGNYLRINRARFADATEEQLGEKLLPAENPELAFVWPDVIERLDAQLDRKKPTWGQGWTLVFSMLTDGFSPLMVGKGITETVLKMVLERTSFRIRVLTKNAVVGTDKWLRFFNGYRDRFVIGLSIGTLDDDWARRVEVGTSSPTARIEALHRLQDAGVPTYGMLCPVFPDVLLEDKLDELIDQIRPDVVEDVWSEPFNDRQNWEVVRDGYAPGAAGRAWLENVYGDKRWDLWSQYATDLFLALHDRALRDGWAWKLRYLLYEDRITGKDAQRIGIKGGIMLQGKRNERGRSQNPFIAAIRR